LRLRHLELDLRQFASALAECYTVAALEAANKRSA
jgi:hypothetical protein